MCRKGKGSQEKRQVLPSSVKPSHYNLKLLPSLETFRFTGHVSISLYVNQATKYISLNVKEVKVTSASVVHFSGEIGFPGVGESILKLPKQNALSIEHRDDEETVVIAFENELASAQKVVLHLEFEGIHNDKMNGFYRSSYTDETGTTRYLLCTQFESSDARKAFPCFDEPNLKATFDVTLHVPKGLVGLSNMNVIEERPVVISGKEYNVVKFATTPLMSTYLLAFCVGDFEYVEAMANPQSPVDAKPVLCRTYTLRGQKHLGQFALETSVKVLEFFSSYFDIAYPLPKLDQIAIPDFAAGAMENWGLITYREGYLLYEDGSFSAQALEDVADTVAHELAHQWFGNLVTMDWWDELWLNEGFATFVGTMAVNHLFPKWDHFTGFLQSYVSEGLEHDALESSHPIHVPVFSPADVEQIFDLISYNKSAAVIRMLESYLGREAFSKGVNQYLKGHAYKNATTTDLWNALSDASDKNVAKVMDSWISETGFPVVSILEEHYNSDEKKMTLRMKQERFFSAQQTSNSDLTVWCIPIAVKTDLGISTALLDSKEGSISFPYVESAKSFYKLNADGFGFYRVNYANSLRSGIVRTVEGDIDSFSVQDRLLLISDSFSIALAGIAQTSTALTLLQSFKNESSGIVLEEISEWLSSVKGAFILDKDIEKGLNRYILGIFNSKVSSVGYEYPKGEDYLQIKKRSTILIAAANADSKEVLEEFHARFNSYVAGETDSLDANLFGIVFLTVLRTSSEPKRDFHLIFDIYKKSSNLTEKRAALRALGAVNDLKIVHRLLYELVLDTTVIKTQDLDDALYGLDHSPFQEVLEMKWTWWTEQFATLISMMEAKNLPVETLLDGYVGEEYAKRAEEWIADKERASLLEPIRREFDTGVESIRVRSSWYLRDREDVAMF